MPMAIILSRIFNTLIEIQHLHCNMQDGIEKSSLITTNFMKNRSYHYRLNFSKKFRFDIHIGNIPYPFLVEFGNAISRNKRFIYFKLDTKLLSPMTIRSTV